VRSSNIQETAKLMETCTLTARRLGEMIRVEKELEKRGEPSERAEEMLRRLDQIAIATGKGPVSDRARKEAMGEDLQLEAATRRLEEEMATIRYVLRNVLRRASQAQEAQELIRLAEIYGSGCTRLMGLLKIEKGKAGHLEAYLQETIHKALEQTAKELGLTL
jgi:hypothetical protein